MLNNVVLVGRLGQDPEIRYTPNGIAVGKFPLAVQRPRRADGQDPGADFIDVVVWRRLAEVVAEHLSKGSMVAVEGRLQVRDFVGRDGQRRRVYEVVARDVRFLSAPNGKSKTQPAGKTQPAEETQSDEGWTEVEPEEVPF